jgi:hypothetical protein
MSYWNGSQWVPLVGSGVPGPAGPPGESIEVFGPQTEQPADPKKGAVWLMSAMRIETAPVEVAALEPTTVTPSTIAAPSAPTVVSIQPPAAPASLSREV